jgi:hypothetical protein
MRLGRNLKKTSWIASRGRRMAKIFVFQSLVDPVSLCLFFVLPREPGVASRLVAVDGAG